MIIGLENELFVGMSVPCTQAEKRALISTIVSGVKAFTTSVTNQEPGHPLPGLMTANGSRIYQDIGDFLEIASPEVRTPLEVLEYQRANEILLLRALINVAPKRGINPAHVKLIRAVTDYNGHYCGMHINISTHNNDTASLVEYLVPFLVTRFYSLAGGFSTSGFIMSQKNSAVKTVSSEDTRENRGIVNLKNEPLASSALKRIHLTHQDACMSEVSTFLSVGCTALVVKMLDDGVCIGPAYSLLNPVKALKQLDTDFGWTMPLELASGLTASALTIQKHFLNAAEVYSKKQGELWMKEVVNRWRWAVDRLQIQGPKGLSHALDPYIKMRLYSNHLKKRGMAFEEFSHWSNPVTMVKPYLIGKPKRDVRNYLKERMPAISFHFLDEHMNQNKLNWSDMLKAKKLYNEMIALDLMYHDISTRGIYFRLRKTEIIDSQLIDLLRLNRALRQPPQDTRACARSKAIQEASREQGTVANWTEVKNANRRAYFPDPLVSTFTWQPLKPARLRK